MTTPAIIPAPPPRPDIVYPTVTQALAAVKGEVEAVPKERTFSGGGTTYKFRGIEAILGAVQRVMAKHGIVTIPRDLELEREPWTGYTSGSWSLYRLKIEWTIYGPAGDSIVTENWGEALDNGDKGLGKARSYAQKDLLIRILELPTDDPDVGDTEATVHPDREEQPAAPTVEVASLEQIGAILGQLEQAMSAADGDYPAGWREARAEAGQPGTYRRESLESMVAGERPPCTAACLPIMAALLETPPDSPGGPDIDQTADGTADPAPPVDAQQRQPCELCGSTRAQRVWHEGAWICAKPVDCAERVRKAAEPPDHTAEPAAQACAGCGESIGPDEALTHDDGGRTFHAEHNPTLGGAA